MSRLVEKQKMVGSAGENGASVNASFTTPITRRLCGALDNDHEITWFNGSLKRIRFTAASFNITQVESAPKSPVKFLPFINRTPRVLSNQYRFKAFIARDNGSSGNLPCQLSIVLCE